MAITPNRHTGREDDHDDHRDHRDHDHKEHKDSKPAEPTVQDEAVLAAPPKFHRLSDKAEDDLLAVAMRALSTNSDQQVRDDQGRQWDFRPDSETGETCLRVVASWGESVLGQIYMPSSQVQSEAGEAFVRSGIAVVGGHPK